jgi:hypothetical protein
VGEVGYIVTPPLEKIGVVSPKRMKKLKVYWRAVLKERKGEGIRRREYPSGGIP